MLNKEQLLAEVRERVAQVRAAIEAAVVRKGEQSVTLRHQARTIGTSDAVAYARLSAHYHEQTKGLADLAPAPYFARCDFGDPGREKSYYVGKFSFTEQDIYSWVTPVARLRFENPGVAEYTRLDGQVRRGNLARKDSYLIVDGAIKFFATEAVGTPRELIYQEHFTRQKSDFVLPEIVALMEKAQDQVIRAEWRGPFVISGPAGSGKTTLALHRIAYLLQSPDTAEYFSPQEILVLVQDAGSRDYFARLLPDLGISGVHIQTFSDWAAHILELKNWQLADEDYGEDALQYAHAKLLALRDFPEIKYTAQIFKTLETAYGNYFSEAQKEKLREQKRAKILDKIDLTVLLSVFKQTYEALSATQEYWQELARGGYRKKQERQILKYNLMVVDEFQNYLPEQVGLLKSTLNPRVQSMVYVGDLGQQTRLGTMQDWQSIDEAIPAERIVRLQKVYRNTRQILEYVRGRGYTVEIPAQVKDGPVVEEATVKSITEEIAHIEKTREPNAFVGVLAMNRHYLIPFKKHFAGQRNVKCLSFVEAQGLEFDEVYIVGGREAAMPQLPGEFGDEVRKIYRDLEYVALTRAMNRLVVLT